MAPVKYGTVINPNVSRQVNKQLGPPVIELWFGDALQMPQPASAMVSAFVVSSAQPSATYVGTDAVNVVLGAAKGTAYVPPANATDFRPSIDAAVVELITVIPNPPPFNYLLFYDPSITGLKPTEAAPYQTDAIFRAIQAFSGAIANSLIIPLTVDATNHAASVVMLQSLVHSALKYAAWNDCILTTIRIVTDQSYNDVTAAFDRLAYIEANLQNLALANKLGMPGVDYNQTSYPLYVNIGNSFVSQYPMPFPDPVTSRQVFGIFIYTTDYFHPIQKFLLNPDPALPKLPKGPDGVGFTDLKNKDYQSLIPIYAAISSGLMNIRAYQGTSYRGEDIKGWNSFTPGKTVRYLNYVSTSSSYPDAKKNPWKGGTPPPWFTNTSHMRLQSQSARDISPYSMHNYESEHLFDHGVTFYITSNMRGNVTVDHIIIGNEVPATILPLLP